MVSLLLIVSRVSAVWALLQSGLLDDQFPARARVGTHLIVFSCWLLGGRSPARWPGGRPPSVVLFGRRVLVRWPGLRCSVFCSLLLCVACLLTARALAVVHLVILDSPVRLAWLHSVFLLYCRSSRCPFPYLLFRLLVLS